VGSLRGTSGELGTTTCPSRAKKPRKFDLISLTPLICCNSLATLVFPVQESRNCSDAAKHISALSPPRAGERACNERSKRPTPPHVRRPAAGRPFRHDRGGHPALVLRGAGPHSQGGAAPRARRCGQRHRRRRRSRPYGGASGRG